MSGDGGSAFAVLSSGTPRLNITGVDIDTDWRVQNINCKCEHGTVASFYGGNNSRNLLCRKEYSLLFQKQFDLPPVLPERTMPPT